MALSLKLMADFERLFTGNLSAHGVHLYDEKVEESGKKRGKSFTKSNMVTDTLYKNHLEGKNGLGIIPINEKGVCRFAVIDVDVYKESVNAIIETLYKYAMPLLPFRSKSGGLHLYIFFAEPVKSTEAIDFMEQFIILLGLSETTEIFPKQRRLSPTQIGSWINLPYYNAIKTKQYMYNEKMKPVLVEEAMLIIDNTQYTKIAISENISNMPLSDGPPCLQSIFMSGSPQFRNEYLFSLARYYKTKYGDDFEFKLTEANNALNNPIEIDRLNRTIISSHKKKDYSYKCAQEPIVSLCRKGICKLRRYGIGGTEISELSYEDFIQYDTDPPYYEWKVNGESLKFYSELDIMNQQKFRELCFRKLHLLPARLKDINWTTIVNQALQNIEIKSINSADDISPGMLFKEYLIEFLERRAMAKNKGHILLDRVYRDDEIGAYVFKAKNLITFLINQKQFRYYGQTEIQDKLRELKGMPKRYYIDGEHQGAIRAWIIPFEGLKDFIEEEPELDKFEVDFKEEYENETF